jgi:hypothetical protein
MNDSRTFGRYYPRNCARRAVLILHSSKAAPSVEELDAPCVRAIIMLASLRKGE